MRFFRAQSTKAYAPDLRYYTYSIWKSVASFDACITFRSSIFSLRRFFTGSYIIIYVKLMDYLRFGKAQAGFVCLLFSPWRHITQSMLIMDLLLSMTSPYPWSTRLRTPYFVYYSRITQLSKRSGVLPEGFKILGSLTGQNVFLPLWFMTVLS